MWLPLVHTSSAVAISTSAMRLSRAHIVYGLGVGQASDATYDLPSERGHRHFDHNHYADRVIPEYPPSSYRLLEIASELALVAWPRKESSSATLFPASLRTVDGMGPGERHLAVQAPG